MRDGRFLSIGWRNRDWSGGIGFQQMPVSAYKDGSASPVLLIGGCAIMSCPAILICQAFFWLRYGGWPEFPLSAAWYFLGLPFPETQWGGIEKCLVWLFAQPTSVVTLAAGIVLIGIGAKILD
jgi:hypothetical protein